MYCVKCGVKLAESEAVCPLCGTVPYHPELPVNSGKSTFSAGLKPKATMNRYAVLMLVSVLYAVLVSLLALCNWLLSKEFSWSYYATGGLLLSYIFFVLPTWFRKPNPVIFVPCDFAATGLFLLGVDLITDGCWFFSMALPATIILGLIVTAVITLVYYLRRGYFFIFGGALIGCGIFSALLELFIYITFDIPRYYFWSIYPLVACTLFGIALVVIGICPSLRKRLEKKFFI